MNEPARRAERVVLVVDDDDDIRAAIGLVLEGEGYRTVDATDGIDALEKLRALPEPPSLVLLDLTMPRMSGAELLEELRADPVFTTIPVVVLSGDAAACRRVGFLGVSAILPKPIDADDLIALVAHGKMPWTAPDRRSE